jgi:hypothetical protein
MSASAAASPVFLSSCVAAESFWFHHQRVAYCCTRNQHSDAFRHETCNRFAAKLPTNHKPHFPSQPAIPAPFFITIGAGSFLSLPPPQCPVLLTLALRTEDSSGRALACDSAACDAVFPAVSPRSGGSAPTLLTFICTIPLCLPSPAAAPYTLTAASVPPTSSCPPLSLNSSLLLLSLLPPPAITHVAPARVLPSAILTVHGSHFLGMCEGWVGGARDSGGVAASRCRVTTASELGEKRFRCLCVYTRLLAPADVCAEIVLGGDTPPGLWSVAVTFNGAGAAASVASDAIVLVAAASGTAQQRSAGMVDAPVLTMTGKEFVAAAAAR